MPLKAVLFATPLSPPALPVPAADVQKGPPGLPYAKVSALAKLPDFLPEIGTLYVDPHTIPGGPWLAYDHNERLVSTIYMISLDDMDVHKKFFDLSPPDDKVDHVSLYYNAGHPGVSEPHYHVVLWHVPKFQESLMVT